MPQKLSRSWLLFCRKLDRSFGLGYLLVVKLRQDLILNFFVDRDDHFDFLFFVFGDNDFGDGLDRNLPLFALELDFTGLFTEFALSVEHEDLRNDEESWLPLAEFVLLKQVTVKLNAVRCLNL